MTSWASDFAINFAVAVGGAAALAYVHYLTYREPERSRITRFIVKYYRTFYRRDPEGAVLATAIAMTMLGAFLAIAAFVQIGAGVFWSFLVSLFGQVE